MQTSARSISRYALIAAVLALLVLVFAWVGGFFSPARISGGLLADTLQRATGKPFPGFRRAHAKGMCVTGRFEANGAGTALSRASLFARGTVPVIGRFSTNAGNPTSADGGALFHALGLRFVLPGGEEWRMAIDHTPIFIVSTAADFIALQKANTPDPKTGKPDPAGMPAFVASHPETAAFLAYVKSAPVPSSFANGTYHSIHAFRFTAADGTTRLVRWQFEPETPFTALDPAKIPGLTPNFLFEDIERRVTQAPLKWHLVIIPANPGDRTDNATALWTGAHRRIDVGTLVLDRVATEVQGNCRDYNYDPMILPRGVSASDDPLLPVRSAAYSASFRRRAAEGPRPDAMTLEQAQAGNATGAAR